MRHGGGQKDESSYVDISNSSNGAPHNGERETNKKIWETKIEGCLLDVGSLISLLDSSGRYWEDQWINKFRNQGLRQFEQSDRAYMS